MPHLMILLDKQASSRLPVSLLTTARSRLICFAVAFNLLLSRAYLNYCCSLQLKNETLYEQIYDAFISFH